MSANYYVKVLAIDNAEITFRVAEAQEGHSSFADSTFALRLLCSADSTYRFDDNGQNVSDSFLGDAVSADNYLDENWVEMNAHEFIADIKLVSLNNFPYADWDYERWNDVLVRGDDGELDFSALAADHPGGVIAIRVPDPLYLDCFRPGMTFDTPAYSLFPMGDHEFDTIGKWMYSDEC